MRRLLTWGVGVGLVAIGATSVGAANSARHPVIYRGSSTAVRFDVSPPLRLIPPVPVGPEDEERERWEDRLTGLEGPLGPQGVDRRVQSRVGGGRIPAPIVSFDAFSGLGSTPPDSMGDVGPNHYVVMVNLRFAVYDKTGTLLFGPFNNNTLWAGFGGDCETDNSGDPVVLHDQVSDRWMLSQFTASGPDFFNCVAISTTPDPAGSYFRYAFTTGTNFPDYPKYGWWSDALYISTREFLAAGPFAGVGAYAVNRADLIAGNPAAQVISFLAPPGGAPFNVGDGLLPADFDGNTPPPAGSPEFYVGSMDLGGPYGAPQDALTLWKFHADFTTPALSSFTLTNTIPVATFDSIFPCTPTARECIPQPGTAVKIDILSYRQRPTQRLAYRNFGTHESLVTNQSVEAAPNIAGIRWWEIRDPNGAPNIFQEGTYAPGVTDGIHRWMGSIAMDQAGNMALGFSASDGTATFPGSWYTGRLASDPPGTMPQGEGIIVNGLGSQLSAGHRWGDYTSLNLDPTDDCTFWYVNEYYPVTSATTWRMRVGSFKFPNCGAGVTGIQGTVTEFGGGALPGVTVTSSSGPSTTTDGSGNYLLSLPPGTYDVTYSKPGYFPQTVNGIVVPASGTVTVDVQLTAIGGGPDLSIGDTSVVEGNSGTTDVFFTVTLSAPSGSPVTADFTTQDGSATVADNDYIPAVGTIVFAPGETSKNITVSVVGDLTFEPDENYFVSIGAVTNANVVDGIGEGLIINDDKPLATDTRDELIHDSRETRDLDSISRFWRISQKARSSYEVIVDAATGDIGPNGPDLLRLDSDGTTVLQTGTSQSGGASKSLHFENAGLTDNNGEFIRVRSAGCVADCDQSDTFRIRAYETTYRMSRFNNSATQVTVVVIANPTDQPVNGTIWFYQASTGNLLASQPVTIAAQGTFVLNTSTIGGLAGQAGSATFTNDAAFGALTGKAVAVEPATGFTFDTAMVPRAATTHMVPRDN